jgi:hypothetical protein
MIMEKANRLAEIFNQKAENNLVPVDFEDWWIEEAKSL